jgi:hypothetical protein
MNNTCFDLHHFLHYKKINDHLEKCKKRMKAKNKLVHYDLISYWKWNQQVKKFHKSYHQVQTKENTYFPKEAAKAYKFQTFITNDDFGNDCGPF